MASNANTLTKKPQLVPETVLKRKHDLDELKAKRAAGKKPGNRKVFSKNKAIRIVKPEKFIMAHRGRVNYTRRFNRVKRYGMQKRASSKVVMKQRASIEEGALAEDENNQHSMITYKANSVGAKVVFVIRIRDGGIGKTATNSVPKQVKRILSSLRLRNLYDGVFVKYDKSTRKMLHLVEPFVIYGVLSPKTVQEVITRRGHCKGRETDDDKSKSKRIPISDNIVIEEALGDDHGIICVEDLVHEICNVGPAFKQANSFLWPFQLTAPKSKFEKDTLKYREGGRGEYGDRGEAIDEVIRSML